MTKILHGWMKVLRRKLWPKSMHVNLLMLIKRTMMLTWNSRLYQQNCRKLYWKEEDYYCALSDKLNDPHTSAKSDWSILKTLYNGEKIPLIPPILISNKLVSNFKKKANHFNAFFTSQCTPVPNNSTLPLVTTLLLPTLVYHLFHLMIKIFLM